MAAEGAHQSNTKKIWKVFFILSLITIVEVVLGIFKPDSLHHVHIFGLSLLNYIFIILTIWKAYYIMWSFMHLEQEKSSFRWSVAGVLGFLCVYLITLVLIEGNYVYDVFHNSQYKWIF
ncbi:MULTISPECIES: cytochrome C oxidase subunit IV family protein [Myroides]|uniref:Cytochrome C oxidase subunit IV n=1 Tax=Myroides albus TaxID=2562892 RepID=A0A6I3LGA2_9FLAO|nr:MULTISPECIES: cytochrome C oxidase subunit IV family protein [Myroides]MTG96834.1 cytochrome C oxidase subunit IV [Myroides albus]MVX36939.1 cytochrome C oxidase subunit IV [Myroides sp. LoEW2-1]UVD78416.1 cytochrome C oxidase subunit IV family protein [Myroides albus]